MLQSQPTEGGFISETQVDTVIRRCREGVNPYRDVVELALDLNPQSVLPTIDVPRGLQAQSTGIEFFRLGQVEAAREVWQDGVRHDCLSTALWNNLAVAQMARGQWDESLSLLDKATHLCVHHPKVAANIGYVQLRREDQFSAEVWAQQATAMNPNLVVPHLLLSEVCCRRAEFREALSGAGLTAKLFKLLNQRA